MTREKQPQRNYILLATTICRTQIQRLSLWVLIKTNYKFKITHDSFKIEVQPVGGVGGNKPTRYDFVCKHKDIGFMNYLNMVRYFYLTEMIDCPNQKVKGVRFKDEEQVKNLEKQYNNLIEKVKQSGKVLF